MIVCMENTRWWAYVEELIGQDNFKKASQKAGFNQSAFSRWKNGARADPDFVVKLARAYNANVLEALVEAEFITEKEAKITHVAPRMDLTTIDAVDLVAELERRVRVLHHLIDLEEGGDQKIIDQMGGLIAPRDMAPQNTGNNVVNMDERRNVTPLPHTDVLAPLPDLENLDYVAQHDTDQPTNDEYAEHHNEP